MAGREPGPERTTTLRRRPRGVAGPAARRRRDPPGLERDRRRGLPARLRRAASTPSAARSSAGATSSAAPPASVFHHYPGAPDHSGGFAPAGTAASETFRTTGDDPWLTTPYTRLEGDNALVYSDVEDDIFKNRCDLDAATLPANDGRRPCVAPAGATTSPPRRAPGPPRRPGTTRREPFPVAAGLRDEDVLPADRLHLEQLGRRLQLAGQPHPGGHAGVLVRQPLPRPPRRTTRRSRFDGASGNFEKTGPDSARDRDPVHVQIDDGANTEDFTDPQGGMPDGIPDGFPDADHRTTRA